jgi:hypothetical protein
MTGKAVKTCRQAPAISSRIALSDTPCAGGLSDPVAFLV